MAADAPAPDVAGASAAMPYYLDVTDTLLSYLDLNSITLYGITNAEW